MVQELIVLWGAAGGAGGQSALYFADGIAAADIATGVQNFFTALRPALATTTTAAVDPILTQRDSGTGALTGQSLLGATPNIVGNGGANAVPNLAQGLIRIRTDVVRNGRFVQGRIFVPGMASSMQSPAGEVTAAGLTALSSAGNALAATVGFGIWHRPQNGFGGSLAPASTAGAWGEFASQRRRRS